MPLSQAATNTAIAPNLSGGITGAFTVDAPGLVGDGVTNNNTALQAAFTAAASGGYLHIPCGTYLITAKMTVTVASGKRVTVEGAGQGCATIAVSGAVGGLQLTLADETAAVDLRKFQITTDQPGTQFAITVNKTTANTLNAYAAPNAIVDVSCHGSDYPNALNPTKYWSQCLQLQNTNNIKVDNLSVIGGGCVSAACNGNGVTFNGNASLHSYAVVLNITHSNFGLCNIGFVYGDWVQGSRSAAAPTSPAARTAF
ncbi:MAG: glycosyl hydrolase family 28-related protein [Methylocella sp.]